MTVHTITDEKELVDITKLWNELREDITMIPGIKDTWPAATFGHIMGGCTIFMTL